MSLNFFVVVIANFMGITSSNQDYPTVSKELAQSLCGIFENSVRLAAFPTQLAKTLGLPWWKNFVRSADVALNGVSNVIGDVLKSPIRDGMLAKMREEGIPDEELKRIVVDFIIAAGDAVSKLRQFCKHISTKPFDFGLADFFFNAMVVLSAVKASEYSGGTV